MSEQTRIELRALRDMVDEADLLLTTTEHREGRSKRASALLGTALKLADQLLKESRPSLRLHAGHRKWTAASL